MPDMTFAETAQQFANDVLTWVGFGTLTGLLAKAVMPGRDPGGAVVTLAMGIAGCVIGCGTLTFFWEGNRVQPISPLGFVAATGGAFILLLFYRLLGGYFFVEGTDGRPHLRRRVARTVRRSPRRARLYDDHYSDLH